MTQLPPLPRTYPEPTKHLMPYVRNNDPRATERWCRAHPGGYTDMDGRAVYSRERGRWEIWFLHWRFPFKDGYTHLVTPTGQLRRLTRQELRRPYDRWDADDVARLRASDGAGGWWRPMRYDESQDIHNRRDCTQIIEAKLSGHPIPVAAWQLAADYARQTGGRLGVKVLPMRGWRVQLRRAHAAGIPTALIGGGKRWRQPVDLRVRPQPDWLGEVWLRPAWRFRPRRR